MLGSGKPNPTLRWLLRLLFVTFATGFALQLHDTIYKDAGEAQEEVAFLYAATAALVAAAIVFFEARFQRGLAREIVAVVFGLAAGLVVTGVVIALVVVFVLPSEGDIAAAFRRIQPAMPLVATALCYVAVTIVLQTKGDFRFLIPYIDFSHRGQEEGGLILDTSVLIDGRIADVAATNIIVRPLLIPDFVIREMQTISDSGDRLKRKRGRRGLDILNDLQKSESVRVQLLETDVPEKCDVDHELVILAKRTNGRVVTNDFNLNKVAQIEGVPVVNLNDLANALKPVVLPGEELSVKILRPGEEPGQGVGYLEDGTMVVVERGRDRIDEEVAITITGSIQTSAGRLVFGRPTDDEGAGANAGGDRRPDAPRPNGQRDRRG
ncbi:MAG: PIN/TRAM domain-containing protein [Planctomycetota bacterium]